MLGSAQLGQWVGLQFGEYLGRQIAFGACHEDTDDAIEKRPFRAGIPARNLPAAVDLRPWMTAVEDQGAIGSCTSNALAGALEYLVHRETGSSIDLSRLFVYFNQRLWDDRVREDSGASIAGGIRVLNRVGIPREESWPYQRDLFAVQPPEAVFTEARKHRVTDWWWLPVDADAFRGCLAAGFPIVFGTRVTESFVKTPRSGNCGMPSGADDRKHGRHALLLAGYHDEKRVFIVRNSWGSDWGDQGYVYMPYDYVLHRDWTQGGWAIRLTTRDAFDAGEHRSSSLGSVPKAPPAAAGNITTRIAGTAVNLGAQTAVRALTGSSLLAGLAGGLLAGMTPGVVRVLGGRDRGAYVDRDRSEEILAALRAGGSPPPAQDPMPWDDGLDEEAARAAGINLVDDRPRVAATASAPPAALPSIPASQIAAAAVGAAVVSPVPQPARPADYVARLPQAIAACWRDLGAARGDLGAPSSEPTRLSENGWTGSVVRFEKGAIFAWNPPPDVAGHGPFAVLSSERAFSRWVELGAGRSVLGWPVAPIQSRPDRGARILWCSRGAVFDRVDRGVFCIHGTLLSHFCQLGGADGELGLPIADQDAPADPTLPQSIQLENGKLLWSPARGAWRE